MAHAIASCKPVPDGLSMFMHHGVMVGVPTSDFPIPIASRGTPPQAPFGLELGIPGPSMAVHASGKKEKLDSVSGAMTSIDQACLFCRCESFSYIKKF